MDHRLGMNARGKQVSSPDSALASDIFDKFCNANTLKSILSYHRQLCDAINAKPNHFPSFYPKLKQHVNSWRAKALWKKFDVRASHKCYARGKACPNTRVLIVGAGPCGLRTAIEAQLLGAKVVVVEKRDRMSRNNVLHLWPFVIEDLRALGAKKFFGKFCAGAIDHISIRQLQCILLKVALLLGVEIHTEISFIKLMLPPSREESEERIGWRGMFAPVDHPVSQYEFDVLIGADGRRNTLEGFNRKEFRGRLAIAITANFINKRTEAEARVEEISGVAFIFNQKFFKDLYEATGIDLENIVYYKDDTHYFVMTAKKQSLLDKGVILNDITDTSKLLARENVDVEALQSYAREAADFSTQYQMPDLEFAVNHYGNPDVNMFDFTSMYAAENASKVIERNGYRLLMILVGDSLLEPFWPTGSGCARGFLSSMDACWAIRGWGSGAMNPLEVLAERESIYRLLGQTTPENLQRDSKSYTLDPSTRYPNLNKSSLLPMQVTSLYDTDDSTSIQRMITAAPVAVTNTQELHKKRRRKDSQVHPDTLLQWLKRQIIHYDNLTVEDLTTSFKDGLVLCAVIHRYRPDLLDFHLLKKEDIAQNNQLAFDILEKELGIPPVMTGQEMEQCAVPDLLTMLSYLTQIYDTFRGEIPHIKHPKLLADRNEENGFYFRFLYSFLNPNESNFTNDALEKNSVLKQTDILKQKDIAKQSDILKQNILKENHGLRENCILDGNNIFQKHDISEGNEILQENGYILKQNNISEEKNDFLQANNFVKENGFLQENIFLKDSVSLQNNEDTDCSNVFLSDSENEKSFRKRMRKYQKKLENILEKRRKKKKREFCYFLALRYNLRRSEDEYLLMRDPRRSAAYTAFLKKLLSKVKDLSEPKKVERPPTFRDFTTATRTSVTANHPPPRLSGRHKRHVEIPASFNANVNTTDRKARKRRSVDKIGATLLEIHPLLNKNPVKLFLFAIILFCFMKYIYQFLVPKHAI